MKQMMPWGLTLSIGALLIAAVGYRSVFAQAADDPKQPLVVAIASVEENGLRTSGMINSAPHFNVVLRNVSDKPLKVWAENCAPGNGSLSLEISAIDGKPLPQPIRVTRHVMLLGTYIRGVTLEPEDVDVREVHLYHYQPGERMNPQPDMGNREDYMGFPAMPSGSGVHLYRMRAVFEISPSEWGTHESIWTGRAVSVTRDYVVNGLYP